MKDEVLFHQPVETSKPAPMNKRRVRILCPFHFNVQVSEPPKRQATQ